MWKCPDCETLNEEDVCVICGKKRPAQGYSGQQYKAPEQQQTQPMDKYEKKPEASKKSPFPLVIVALVIVIVAMTSIIIALLVGNDSSEKEIVVVTQEPVTVTETEETVATESVSATPEAVPQYSGAVDENTIQKIRNRYNHIQEISSDCDGFTTNSGVRYYYYNDKLVRIDVPAEYGFNYTKCYYYDENEDLCFAFVFIDDKVENRFYFENGRMIRWMDEFKVNHDNEYNNQQYRDWEEKVLTDASNHEI